MAVRVISFPFRLDGTGAVASVEQNSDQDVEEQIALAALTRPGERIQVPTFGIVDPAFRHFQAAALQRHLIDFGPDVEITAVTMTPDGDGRERVAVSWQRREVTQ